MDSYNDADVDDYSTQDDGGESTEPENSGRGGWTCRWVEKIRGLVI